MKKIVCMVMAVVMALGLTACGNGGNTPAGSNGGNGEVLQLTLAHVLDAEHPVNLGAEYFAKRLEELSGGTMVTTVHPNSGLGGEEEVVEMQSYSDTVTFSVPSGCALQKYCPATYAADFYFQFENYDQVWAFYDGEYGDYIKDSLDGTGLVVTYFWDNGFRNLTTKNTPVHTTADLKGLKIRVMSAETHLAAWNAMGAAATPIAFSEVYSALQQGTVDGNEQPIFLTMTSRFEEVQKYLSLTGHFYTSGIATINKNFFESLPEDLQKVVTDAADVAREAQYQYCDEDNATALEYLKTKMEVNEITPENHQLFVDVTAPVYDEVEAVVGADLMAIARAAQNAD